ncbi:MAG: hypothetical protein JWQ14_2777 [Adhaeribacter sp.]|nr:hypothetical protein [Adhaeribacter sp.]
MGLQNIVNNVKKEIEVLRGEDVKDKEYTNEITYPDEDQAREAFTLSKQKLFGINKWSDLPGINSTFELFDAAGNKSRATIPQVGDFIKIILPGPAPENWVQVTDLRQDDNLAEFVVHPSPAPASHTENTEEVKHFFGKEASSTFRVERQGKLLKALEIGRNERINNQGVEAGNRAVVNTIVAEGGWAGFQALQWDKLTRYLVHLQETKV